MVLKFAQSMVLFGVLVLTPSVSLADRAPTPEELTKLESALRAEGFTQWKEIEFEDNGKWEVDDAISADGKRYDLKLDQSMKIIERKAE